NQRGGEWEYSSPNVPRASTTFTFISQVFLGGGYDIDFICGNKSTQQVEKPMSELPANVKTLAQLEQPMLNMNRNEQIDYLSDFKICYIIQLNPANNTFFRTRVAMSQLPAIIEGTDKTGN
ncbi:MAG: hypothetical protein EAZ20_00610, partial [Bacteroidetes bacterium]